MLRLAFDFIITWRETRTRPNAYTHEAECLRFTIVIKLHYYSETIWPLEWYNFSTKMKDKFERQLQGRRIIFFTIPPFIFLYYTIGY